MASTVYGGQANPHPPPQKSVILIHRKLLAVAVIVLAVSPVANAQNSKYEGVAAIEAASINPPNPVDGCDRAKRDAEAKAVKAGTKGLVS
jgi:hypothetical protein